MILRIVFKKAENDYFLKLQALFFRSLIVKTTESSSENPVCS